MTNEELARLVAEHAEHCSHKCCGNGPWSHHPEGGDRLCPMALLLAEVARLREANKQLRLAAIGTGGRDDEPSVYCYLCDHFKPGTTDASQIEHAEWCPLDAALAE
jgi:hypothetical protein